MQNEKTVSIKKISAYDYAEIKQGLDELISSLSGGWQTIVPRGSRVLIKPNF